MKTMIPDEAVHAIYTRLTFKHWTDRASSMLRHLTYSNTNPDDRIANLRVNPDWPLAGSITFTRVADGKRCRLYLQQKRRVFKAVAK